MKHEVQHKNQEVLLNAMRSKNLSRKLKPAWEEIDVSKNAFNKVVLIFISDTVD